MKRDAKVLREIRSPTSKQGLDDSIVASKRARKCLGMKQVQAILKGMGVTDDQEELNYCTLAAIKKGHLICQGMPEDLDIVILETKGDCGHKVRVTLRDMLQQSDKPEGSGHMCQVNCHVYWVIFLCIGSPELDNGVVVALASEDV